jgi:DDE_Tnp_1-associated
MPVSAVTSTDKEVPGLLEVLAQVPDPRRKRGRRFNLVFVLAVAAVSALAGATGFRELGDYADDLPQALLAALGGGPVPATAEDHRTQRDVRPVRESCLRRVCSR